MQTGLKKNSASNAFIRLGAVYCGILKKRFSLVECKGRKIRGVILGGETLQEYSRERELGETLIKNENEGELLKRKKVGGFEIIRKVLKKLIPVEKFCGYLACFYSEF